MTTTSDSAAMEAEFDTVAGWTEEAVAELGPEYAIPAGCRGSGSPASLAWLAEALEFESAGRLLDVGAGVGGPAAWAAEHFGLTPFCVDPMPAAVHAARRLFGLAAAVAGAESLPFATGAFDAAWCLGVLCTVPDRPAVVAELRRVLAPGGRLGLLVFVADGPLPPPLPEGNDFPDEPALRALLDAHDLTVLEAVDAGSLPAAPLAWQSRADRVEAFMADRHGDDPRWLESQHQAELIGGLLAGGHLRARLLHAVAS